MKIKKNSYAGVSLLPLFVWLLMTIIIFLSAFLLYNYCHNEKQHHNQETLNITEETTNKNKKT